MLKHDFCLYFVKIQRTPVLGFKPRIEISKFLYFCTYVHHNCVKKAYVHCVYPTSTMECLSETASILPLTLLLQTQFMLVEPRVISERSRCFLVIFSASRKVLDDNRFFLHKLLDIIRAGHSNLTIYYFSLFSAFLATFNICSSEKH